MAPKQTGQVEWEKTITYSQSHSAVPESCSGVRIIENSAVIQLRPLGTDKRPSMATVVMPKSAIPELIEVLLRVPITDEDTNPDTFRL